MSKRLPVTIILVCSVLAWCGQTNAQAATLQDLSAALVKNGVKGFEAVMKANPDLAFARYPDGRTFLHTAALGGNTNVIALMLSYKADVNARDTNGVTPLHVAASWGNARAVVVLLANNAEVNAVDQRGETPLLEAAMAGKDGVAELLIANKADVGAQDNQGRTALHIAAMRADQKLAKLLLSNKADVNAMDKSENTPMQLLTRGRTAEYVAELRRESQTVTNSRDVDGSIIMRTPRDEMVKLLFQHGGHP